ncbi:MAG: sulfatase-like hydrolase/transferase [Acidobacteria bacterium]|nr:sulfatase-like hydrolase/transferase [Acidobacteriota bacterium]
MSAISRRDLLKAGTAAAAWPARAAAGRPNILIVVCDQMCIDAISAHRAQYPDRQWAAHWVTTPNLDRLITRGVSFTQSHSENPVCCPARSAIFTGRWSVETGVIQNNIGIDRNVPNMGQWFEQNSDYERVYCGKWHIGGQWNYPLVSGNRKIPGFDTMPVGNEVTGGVSDYEVSSSVEAYIRNHRGPRPFLMVAGLLNPHDICFWPRLVRNDEIFQLGDKLPPLPPNHLLNPRVPFAMGNAGRFTDAGWRYYIHDYARMIEKLDGDVGRMLNAVEERGGDTLMIFTGDHGEGLGRHGRLQKWFPFDSALKVPFIASWPGHFRQGVVDTSHLVSGVDIMPTVCDYAGIQAPPHARGQSLRPLVEGRGTPWRDSVFAELQLTTHIVRTGRYKYVKFYKSTRDFEKPFLTDSGEASIFDPARVNRFQVHDYCMFYDMEKDPWEMNNLADDPAFAGEIRAHDKLLREQYEARILAGRHYDRN